MLRLGYQQTTIKYVYDRLREFIIKRRNHNLYSGDIELAVSILHDLLRHLDQYPPAETEEKISLKVSMLLYNPTPSRPQELRFVANFYKCSVNLDGELIIITLSFTIFGVCLICLKKQKKP